MEEVVAFAEALVEQGSLELFHNTSGDAFATVGTPIIESVRTFPLESKAFERQFVGAFHAHRLATGGKRRVIAGQSWGDAQRTLEVIACHEGGQHEVFLRVARSENQVIIDLGDERGSAVVVTPAGWTVVEAPPVPFRRPRTLRPLPAPTRGGSVDTLRRYLHVSDEGFPLVLSWLVNALAGSGPYPLLVIYGEQGSAKTTTARFCRLLVDPAEAPLRALPHDERDLVIAAYNGHVLGFDNVSGMEPRLSDALCRVAGGEGFGTRTLYADREEEVFASARPVVLTGIAEAASRPDLLDRSYVVEAPRIPDDQRLDERRLRSDFGRDSGQMFGVLLDGLASGLRHLLSVELVRPPRMADAARFAVAAEEGLRLPPGTMVSALDSARESATSAVLESSALAQAVVDFVREKGPWRGTAAALLEELNRRRDQGQTPRGWPAGPQQTANSLRRVAPHLRAAGVPVHELGRRGRDRSRLLLIGADPDEQPQLQC